jgi:hypothetical protein
MHYGSIALGQLALAATRRVSAGAPYPQTAPTSTRARDKAIGGFYPHYTNYLFPKPLQSQRAKSKCSKAEADRSPSVAYGKLSWLNVVLKRSEQHGTGRNKTEHRKWQKQIKTLLLLIITRF